MLQSALFDETSYPEAKYQKELYKPSLNTLFDGKPLTSNGALLTTMKRQGKSFERLTPIGAPVDCYRNLNMPEYFSIRARDGDNKGRVTGYAKSIVIRKPHFVVGEKARQRIINIEFKKNVHAFCRGEFIEAFDGSVIEEKLSNPLRVSYSPYVAGHFYTIERDKCGALLKQDVKPLRSTGEYEYAIVSGADVLLTNL